MEKEQTIMVGTRIPTLLYSEIQKEIKETGQNMSEFLAEAAKEKIFNQDKEKLEIEISGLKKQLTFLEKKKETFVEKENNFKKIPENEISFLLECLEKLKENPTFVVGRIQLYKNKFNKFYRISPDEFFQLCYAAEEQSQENLAMKELKNAN